MVPNLRTVTIVYTDVAANALSLMRWTELQCKIESAAHQLSFYWEVYYCYKNLLLLCSWLPALKSFTFSVATVDVAVAETEHVY